MKINWFKNINSIMIYLRLLSTSKGRNLLLKLHDFCDSIGEINEK